MIFIKCNNCGLENKDEAKFCKNCGNPLTDVPPVRKISSAVQNEAPNTTNSSTGKNKKIIIICLTVIICAALICGSVLFISFNKHSNDSNTENLNNSKNINETHNNQNAETTVDNTNDVAVTDAKANEGNIKIISGSFYTGNKLSDKTYCDVYVGEQYAGTKLKIQIFYSRDGSTLNPGNIVPKTVDGGGYISLRSANAFKYYPDHASITLYDTNGYILDTKEVEMSATKGTQTF